VILSFTRSARADFERLRDFIARHDESAAERVARQLQKGIGLLVKQPRMGRRVRDADGHDAPEEIRDWLVGNYIIRYLIAGERIVVLRAWHHREDRGS
jgi:plasmid stabilization system protein ParE